MTRWKDVLAGGLVAIVALAVWLPQIGWGLPSRAADRWLFGGRPAWSGAEIVEKLLPLPVRPGEGRGEGLSSAQGESADPHPNPLPGIPGEGTRGADVDSTPILDRSQPVLLNDTDGKRAAIVQRFRLMSGQPDEFIQFKALAEMAARRGLSKFDPRLYQYGGLWIYPVGGLVRGAMAVGWIESPLAGVPAREFYLDRPDAFAKFYIVGRAYSMAWGVVAAIAVYLLTRKACSRDATPSLALSSSSEGEKPATALRRGYFFERALAMFAALAFIMLPSVQTSAHEAKPHLAGAALCLLATLAAGRFVETGKRRWLLIAGALCGAAMGMVVSMALSLIVLPAAVWMRQRTNRLEGGSPCRSDGTEGTVEASRSDALQGVLATALMLLVYIATNPFVLINAIVAPHLLVSNLGNSTAMYGVRGPLAMIPDAWRIAGHAMTPLGFRFALAAAMAVYIVRFFWRATVPAAGPVRKVSHPRHGVTPSRVLAAPAALIAIQFILFAAGKPAEYARFGLVVWAALCVAAAVAIRHVFESPARSGLVLLVCLGFCLLIPPVGAGKHGYDPWRWTDVDDSAVQLETMRALGTAGSASPWRLGVAYEPAPWSTPPVNLFDQEIVLVRATQAMLNEVDAFVWPVNLESQCIEASHDHESLDWHQNRFGHRAEARDGDEERWRGGW